MSKKEQIYEAAVQLFIELGFHATPTSKIAVAAGVSNGTLFHYFKTKEDLVSGLYAWIKSQLRTALIRDLDQGESTRQAIWYIWRNWVQWGVTHHDHFLFLQQFSNSPYINSVNKEEASREFQFTRDLIIKGIQTEVLMNVEVALINSLIFSSIEGVVKYAISQGKDLNDNDYKTLYSMLWKSIEYSYMPLEGSSIQWREEQE